MNKQLFSKLSIEYFLKPNVKTAFFKAIMNQFRLFLILLKCAGNYCARNLMEASTIFYCDVFTADMRHDVSEPQPVLQARPEREESIIQNKSC